MTYIYTPISLLMVVAVLFICIAIAIFVPSGTELYDARRRDEERRELERRELYKKYREEILRE